MPFTPTTVRASAAELGLDPAGYRDPGSGQVVPWDADASRIADVLDEDTTPDADETYTVFEFLTDQAGAHGMPLEEYLALIEDDSIKPVEDVED